MNFLEAIKQGKAQNRAIREKRWPDDRFIYFDDKGLVRVGAIGKYSFVLHIENLESLDWELSIEYDFSGNRSLSEEAAAYEHWLAKHDEVGAKNAWFAALEYAKESWQPKRCPNCKTPLPGAGRPGVTCGYCGALNVNGSRKEDVRR